MNYNVINESIHYHFISVVIIYVKNAISIQTAKTDSQSFLDILLQLIFCKCIYMQTLLEPFGYMRLIGITFHFTAAFSKTIFMRRVAEQYLIDFFHIKTKRRDEEKEKDEKKDKKNKK